MGRVALCLTFLAAGHAQLAAIGALVAFHAGDARLTGAKSSHLLAVITDGAHRVAVTSCARRKRGQGQGQGEGIEHSSHWSSSNDALHQQHTTQASWISVLCTGLGS